MRPIKHFECGFAFVAIIQIIRNSITTLVVIDLGSALASLSMRQTLDAWISPELRYDILSENLFEFAQSSRNFQTIVHAMVINKSHPKLPVRLHGGGGHHHVSQSWRMNTGLAEGSNRSKSVCTNKRGSRCPRGVEGHPPNQLA